VPALHKKFKSETQIGDARKSDRLRSEKNEMHPHQRGLELARWRVKGDDLLFGVCQLT
jgi:hypothetical protein